MTTSGEPTNSRNKLCPQFSTTGSIWSKLCPPPPVPIPTLPNPPGILRVGSLTTIRMLPAEMLDCVFNHLDDNKDILACRGVCHFWRAIIDQSIGVPLEVTEKNFFQLFGKKEIQTRRVHSLTIQSGAAIESRIPIVCPFNPTHLKNLKYFATQINPTNFKKILETCLGIETLTIEYLDRFRSPSDDRMADLGEIRHPGLRHLNFFNIQIKQTKEVRQILGILQTPNLSRISMLGNVKHQKNQKIPDIRIFQEAFLNFVRRHRNSLQEINPYMVDDEHNRNIAEGPMAQLPETTSGQGQVYCVRILNTCSSHWRPLLEDLRAISRLEIALNSNWPSATNLLAIARTTLTAIDLSCDLSNVDLRFFHNFENLKELSMTSFQQSSIANVDSLPNQLEELHLCVFPLTNKNWDDLLGDNLQNLTGLEIGVQTDETPTVTFNTQHFEKLTNHSNMLEVYLHGKAYVRKWTRFEKKRKLPEKVKITKTDVTIHLEFEENLEEN